MYSQKIFESNLQRILDHTKSDRTFGVMSPFRSELSKNVNLRKYEDLKKILREQGIGFIEMSGGWKWKGETTTEKSLFLPNISKETLLRLGKDYKQDAVIWKGYGEFVLIDTKYNFGKVDAVFEPGKIDTMPGKIDSYWSILGKGPHSNIKFVFKEIVEEPDPFDPAMEIFIGKRLSDKLNKCKEYLEYLEKETSPERFDKYEKLINNTINYVKKMTDDRELKIEASSYEIKMIKSRKNFETRLLEERERLRKLYPHLKENRNLKFLSSFKNYISRY